MKKLVSIMVISLAVAVFSPFNLGNAYLRASDFETVAVVSGDSVWTIAERYAKSEGERKVLVEAIIAINGLGSDARIFEGQSLNIPIVRR